MSIVVAVRKGRRTVLAADTLTCFGSHKDTSDNIAGSKITRVGSALIAGTGWTLYQNILEDFLKPKSVPQLKDQKSIYRFMLRLWQALGKRYALVNNQCHDQDSPFADLDATFLIAHSAGIFRVSADMSVVRYQKYHAIGSGADYAHGALHTLYDDQRNPRTIAERAVRTAMHFDVYCGGQVDVVELKGG